MAELKVEVQVEGTKVEAIREAAGAGAGEEGTMSHEAASEVGGMGVVVASVMRGYWVK